MFQRLSDIQCRDEYSGNHIYTHWIFKMNSLKSFNNNNNNNDNKEGIEENELCD